MEQMDQDRLAKSLEKWVREVMEGISWLKGEGGKGEEREAGYVEEQCGLMARSILSFR
jgi:hypothetical protein